MIELKIPTAADNVIELSVVREDRMLRALKGKCRHNRIWIDTSLATLTCKDCEKALNPVEWVAMLTEHWAEIKRMGDAYLAAKTDFEDVSKCKCRHCGKMTPIPRRRGGGFRLV